jgi:hypothetical protein
MDAILSILVVLVVAGLLVWGWRVALATKRWFVAGCCVIVLSFFAGIYAAMDWEYGLPVTTPILCFSGIALLLNVRQHRS